MTNVTHIVGLLQFVFVMGFYIYALFVMIKDYDTIQKSKQLEWKILLLVTSIVSILMSIFYLKMDMFSVLFIEGPFVLFVFADTKQHKLESEAVKENPDPSSLYKKMAYTDPLTSLGNRYAFNECAKSISLKDVCIISFDVNNLKYHNDTYGHYIGDKLLIHAGKVITKIYGENVFRCGGDEFLVLTKNETIESLDKKQISLQNLCNLYNVKSNKIKLEIACGYAVYEIGDKAITDIVERADHRMYENKKLLKGEGSTIR